MKVTVHRVRSSAPTDMYYAGVPVAYLVIESRGIDPTIPLARLPSVVAIQAVPEDSNPDRGQLPEYMINLFETAPPNTVASLTLHGEIGRHGCPPCCCSGMYSSTYLTVEMSQYLATVPSDVQEMLEDSAVETFLTDINRILLETHWPISPCILAHFLLPLSPVCFLLHFQILRQERLIAAIARENETIASRGVHW